MAVKFGITYQLIVNKKKLIVLIAIAFIFNALVYGLIYVFDTKLNVTYWKQTFSSIIYTNLIRIGTCVGIITMGKITLKIRKSKIINIRKMTVPAHGEQAENLDALTKIKRGIKDVVVLNFWTCIFLVPVSLLSILSLFDIGMERKIILQCNIFAYSIQVLSNPIIYIFSQSKIRNFIKPKNRTYPNL